MSSGSPVITVFEHQVLNVGDAPNGVLFSQACWDLLIHMYPTLPHPYYTLTHRGIKLSHYVGVLKTSHLTLEILPKADAHANPSPGLWRHRLVDMIAECRYLKRSSSREALRSFRAGALLDFFLLDFLAEVETICQRGLAKQYRPKVENVRSLKGQLLFAQHVRHNAIHRERFFVKHQRHTTHHLLHQLLKKALQIVAKLSLHPLVQQQSRRLLYYFTEVPDAPDRKLMTPLTYNRQTVDYRTAADAARQILAASFSHVYHGVTHQGFAMLFDMNMIFEEFVYQRLRKLGSSYRFNVRRQTTRSLWGETKVRPDIIVELPDQQGRVVLDTKWKILTRPRPAAQDLHQLYVYNQLFEARRGVLLYPNVHGLASQHRRFEGPGNSYAEVSFITIADGEQPHLNPHLNELLLGLLF